MEPSTVILLSLGLIAGAIIAIFVMPMVKKHNPTRMNPFVRYRPLLIDEYLGELGEIDHIDDVGEGKIRIYLDTGGAVTHYAKDITDFNKGANLGRSKRPAYIVKRPSVEKTSGETTKAEERWGFVASREDEFNRYRDAAGIEVRRAINDAKDLSESAKRESEQHRTT